MELNEDDNSPFGGAMRFWSVITDDDPKNRELLGGMLHPLSRQRPEQIRRDIEALDRPALATRLEESGDETVYYALVIEGAETVDNQLVESIAASRYLTLKWVDTLNYWSVFHYGEDRVRPSAIPR